MESIAFHHQQSDEHGHSVRAFDRSIVVIFTNGISEQIFSFEIRSNNKPTSKKATNDQSLIFSELVKEWLQIHIQLQVLTPQLV
jgi:hypothetical protein